MGSLLACSLLYELTGKCNFTLPRPWAFLQLVDRVSQKSVSVQVTTYFEASKVERGS